MINAKKKIEENNSMGKTKDHLKKIRDTKGKFHAIMGSIKDRNGMDLTESEDIKKRWKEYTEELYKKDLSFTFFRIFFTRCNFLADKIVRDIIIFNLY